MPGASQENATAAQDRPCASPVLVRSDASDPGGRARELETALAPVIEIMERAGITAAGIRVTGDREVKLNRQSKLHDDVVADRLRAARERIRREAEQTTGLYALPDALLVLHDSRLARAPVAIAIMGDNRTGHLWEDGPVTLVPAEA